MFLTDDEAITTNRFVCLPDFTLFIAATIEFPVAIESVVFYVTDAVPLRELTISRVREIAIRR